jgi:hypothetical protein
MTGLVTCNGMKEFGISLANFSAASTQPLMPNAGSVRIISAPNARSRVRYKHAENDFMKE